MRDIVDDLIELGPPSLGIRAAAVVEIKTLRELAKHMAYSLAKIAGAARAGDECCEDDGYKPILAEAKTGIGSYCFDAQKPIACDLFEVKRGREFVCRTCETSWQRHEDDSWSSGDWNGKFPWEK